MGEMTEIKMFVAQREKELRAAPSPDFLRLQAFLAWCFVFPLLVVLALCYGIIALLKVALLPFSRVS